METVLSGFSIIFSWLIDYTIDISIFICIIFTVKSIVSGRFPAWWHYGLWLVLIIRMIIPFKYERQVTVPEFIPLPVDLHIVNDMILEKNRMITGLAKGASSGIRGINLSLDEILLLTWLIGALFLGSYYIYRNLRFWFSIKKKPMLADRDLLALLEDCKKRMKVNRVIGITVTNEVKSPALFGYLRPRILLPRGVLEKLSHPELTCMFMHELGHLKRHDIGVSWVVTFLQAFQWFNPLVWLAFYQMRIDQESACDAAVLSALGQARSKDYAATILGFLEKFCQNRQVTAMAGIIENKSRIKRRITMIAKYGKYSKKIKITAVLMLMFTGFIFYTLTCFAKEAATGSTAISEETRMVMERAVKDIDKEDYYGALDELNNYLNTTPVPENIPENYYEMLAHSYMYLDRYDDALRVAGDAQEAYPDSERMLTLHAVILYKAGIYTEAAFEMEEIFNTMNKKDIGFLDFAFSSYFKAGDLKEAKRVLKRMISLSSSPNPKWLKVIISICIKQGDNYEAQEYMELLEEMGETYSPYPDDKLADNLNTDIFVTVTKKNRNRNTRMITCMMTWVHIK